MILQVVAPQVQQKDSNKGFIHPNFWSIKRRISGSRETLADLDDVIPNLLGKMDKIQLQCNIIIFCRKGWQKKDTNSNSNYQDWVFFCVFKADLADLAMWKDETSFFCYW